MCLQTALFSGIDLNIGIDFVIRATILYLFISVIYRAFTPNYDLLQVPHLLNLLVRYSTHILETGGGKRLLRGELMSMCIHVFELHKLDGFLANTNSYSKSFLTVQLVHK